MIINKYAAALLSITVVVLTALVAIPQGSHSPETLWQVALLGLGAVVTYMVPLLNSSWASALKTGAALLAAVIGALIPLLGSGTMNSTQVMVLILAGLNALAVEVGAGMRKSDPILARRM